MKKVNRNGMLLMPSSDGEISSSVKSNEANENPDLITEQNGSSSNNSQDTTVPTNGERVWSSLQNRIAVENPAGRALYDPLTT